MSLDANFSYGLLIPLLVAFFIIIPFALIVIAVKLCCIQRDHRIIPQTITQMMAAQLEEIRPS